MITRRHFLSAAVGGAAVLIESRDLLALTRAHDGRHARAVKITVFLSPTCGCCADRVTHLNENGFEADVRKVDDVDPIKRDHKIPQNLWSCHTAVVGAYVIEGHVPADLITRLLQEHPDVAGLAVAGMPMGAPGMEHGNHKEPYDVLSFGRRGEVKVYAKR